MSQGVRDSDVWALSTAPGPPPQRSFSKTHMMLRRKGDLRVPKRPCGMVTYHLAHSKFLHPCYQLWSVLLTREPTFLLYRKRLSKDACPKSQSHRTWSSGRLHAELTGPSEWVSISPLKSTGACLTDFTGWGGGTRQGRTTTNSRQIAKRGWGWLRL